MDRKEERLVGLTIAGGVWLTGVAAAMAIAFALTRPIKIPAVAWFEEPRAANAEDALGAEFELTVPEVTIPEGVLEVAPIWIFGEPARAVAGGAEPTPATVDEAH